MRGWLSPVADPRFHRSRMHSSLLALVGDMRL